MITIPVYDMIILPDIVYYFKSDVFQELNIEDARKDEEVLFLMLKEDKMRSEMTADDFYPIGVSGRFQSRDENGVISVRTTERVNVLQVNVTEDEIVASITLREDLEDLSQEEYKKHYSKMRDSLLKFVQGFQWGVMARGYILHWKSMEETVS